MALTVQYDLFKKQDDSEKEAFEKRVLKIESTLDKVRKGGYANMSVLRKDIMELQEDVQIIKRNLCK